MTVENCIAHLADYKKRIVLQGPGILAGTLGRGKNSDERKYILIQAKKAYANMKDHILNSKKFRGHPIIKELENDEEPEEETEEDEESTKVNPNTEKKDGKKPA